MAMIKILTDDSPMPFGKFRGTKMADVPYWYLLWYGQKQALGQVHDRVKEDDRAVREYIRDNKDVLLEERKRARQNKRNYMFNPCK
ncbi:MAG: DUF3820 family protein [Bacteroidales bacterium]|jgi:hypothetical protein|nr:DUF3820 family protein [Bacteroidales bacterium]